MRLINIKIILTLISIFILYQCDTGNQKRNNSSKTSSFENFDEFYKKFHSDSLFQISRIKFPLAGKKVDGFEEIKWTKKKWSLMKTMIYDIDTTVFKTEYKKSSKEFKQKIWLENSGFNTEYRFKVIHNKWYLVYALDINL
jgi:hypothetical protein